MINAHGFSNPGYISNLAKILTNPTVLLIGGTGTNNSTTIIDRSPLARTISNNGSPKNSTTQINDGVSSVQFDGNSYCYTPITNDINFTNKDFTLEGKFYLTNGNYYQALATTRTDSNGQDGFWVALTDTNQLVFYASSGGGSWNLFSGLNFGTVQFNTWNHWAISRTANSWSFSLNGTIISVQTNSSAINDRTGSNFLIGGDSNTAKFSGYYYLRVSNIGLYTGIQGSTYTIPNF